MEEMRETAPTEAIGSTIHGGPETKKEILGYILLDLGRVAIPGRVRHMEVSSLSWIKTGEDSCKQPPR
jgi:hypothetical protein